MLVLRLLLMVLTIICLMEGHAEVSSSTTGIRNGTESPVVKPNEPEVQILDRKKKKKPKKPKKPSKKKKPKPKKPKPAKPVTTTPTMTTSTLKTTTILTTPTMETTATTTDSPTMTATTFKTSTSTATTTEASSSTASTTTATTTIPTTTMTTTATTSSLITTAATTADSGAQGECKATNGKPCIFPFKDGKEEYNECKNHGGTYFWCATSVYDSGKYKHWSYCPKDGPCPLEGDGEECRAINNKPCVFPFKDGKKEYNVCADHGGLYFWCATGTNSAGKYTAWSECPKDGSCPLPQKSTTPAMTSPATAASTTPLTTGTTVATDQMEEKVIGTLENLVLGESRDDSLQMAHMLDKKLDTIIKDLEGETSKTELSNFDDIPPESGKLNLTLKRGQDDQVRDGTELGKGLMFVLSTVDSMKSVSRMSGDCCLDCTNKYPDTELAEYWETLDTCYCYKKIKNPDVEPKTRASSQFTTKACATGEPGCYCNGYLDEYGEGECTSDFPYSSKKFWCYVNEGSCSDAVSESGIYWSYEACNYPEGISDCRKATEKDCPTEHTFLEGGFTTIPYDGMLDSKHNVTTKCACRHLCDVRPTECKAFLFKTCSEGLEARCILLNVDKPATSTTGLYKKHFAFCRRDVLITRRKQTRTNMLCPDGYTETEDTNGLEAYGKVENFADVSFCHDFCNEDLLCVAVEIEETEELFNCRFIKRIMCKRLKIPSSTLNGHDKVTKFCLLLCNDIWLEKYQGVRNPNIIPSSEVKSERVFALPEKDTIVKNKVTWPWAALITNKGGRCTGTLISCDFILTAKHCILDQKTFEPLEKNRVLLGSYDHKKGQLSDGEYQFHDSTLFYIGSGLPLEHIFEADDVALLKLKSPINPLQHKDIRPIKLYSSPQISHTYDLWAIGYGLTTTNVDVDKNNKLRQTDALEINNKKSKTQNEKNIFLKDKAMKGVWKISENGLCKGDSGGPTMTEQIDVDKRKRWLQIGVNAGAFCDEKTETNRDYDVTVKNVLFYKKWIEQCKGLQDMEVLGPFGKTSEASPVSIPPCSSEPVEACKAANGYCKSGNICDFSIGKEIDVGGACGEGNVCCNFETFTKHEMVDCTATGGVCQDQCSCQGEIVEGKCGVLPKSIKCCKTTNEILMNWGWCTNTATGELEPAKGFTLKVQPFNTLNDDNTALNGIKLICKNGNIVGDETKANYAKWHSKFEACTNGYLIGIRVTSRKFSPQEDYDNTGLESIDFICKYMDGTRGGILGTEAGKDNFEERKSENEEEWAEEEGECTDSFFICGISVQKQTHTNVKDRRGLDQIKIQCCRWSTDLFIDPNLI